jgi:ankyrin repeat protein
MFAALTVFMWPETFQKDDKPVASYAFPFYVIGSTLLFIGMFFCAFIMERSSKEYYLQPQMPSKIYWLQPGKQNADDQVFKAFLTTKEYGGPSATENLSYIKSVRDYRFHRKYLQIYSTLASTLLGFIFQFVGLRGLHASVILAQLGSTFLMAIVRTILRTERMAPEENEFRDEQKLLSSTQQELDCFAFHLENVDSFHLRLPPDRRTALSSPGYISHPSLSLAKQLIHTRARLAELTSSSNQGLTVAWDDMPIRKVAQNLARAIEMTVDLMSNSWEFDLGKTFTFNLLAECRRTSSQSSDPVIESYCMILLRGSDTLRWRIDVNELEAILGLWVWSIQKANDNTTDFKLHRLVGLGKDDAQKEETDLYFQEWVFRQTEATMVNSGMMDFSSQLFGFASNKHSYDTDTLAVRVDSNLETMAAQDIYIQFLGQVFGHFKELGGDVDIVPGPNSSFLAQNSRINELVQCIETCDLGTREEALLCIVPILNSRGLLPELAGDSINVRKRTTEYIGNGKWKDALNLLTWLCQRSNSHEFERSVYELGYLCRQAILEGDDNGRHEGSKHMCELLQSDLRARFFQTKGAKRPIGWMNSSNHKEWWKSFSKQLGWIAWHASRNVSASNWIQPYLEALGASEHLSPSHGAGLQDSDSERSIRTLQQWLTYPTMEIEIDRDVPGYDDELAFKWAVSSQYYAVLYWFLVKWTEMSKDLPLLAHAAYLFAAKNHSEWAIQVLRRHGADIEAENHDYHSVTIKLILDCDLSAIKMMLANGAAPNGKSAINKIGPLEAAAQAGYNDIVLLLLTHYGATIDSTEKGKYSALYWATEEQKLETVDLLLQHGADVNTIGIGSMTPLHNAVSNQNIELVRKLVQFHAKLNVTNDQNRTPLMLASMDSSSEILRLLLENGADIEMQDWDHRTALDLARRSNNTEAILVLEAETQRRAIL